MRTPPIVAAALALLLFGCAMTRESTPIPEYLVQGTATAGPTCPVAQDPPDPDCDDRPVADATMLILDAAGGRYSELVTDDTGVFRVFLPEGSYTLEPQPVEGLLGTADSQMITVGPGMTSDLVVQYDTGIR